jgi:hypothetical protein
MSFLYREDSSKGSASSALSCWCFFGAHGRGFGFSFGYSSSSLISDISSQSCSGTWYSSGPGRRLADLISLRDTR